MTSKPSTRSSVFSRLLEDWDDDCVDERVCLLLKVGDVDRKYMSKSTNPARNSNVLSVEMSSKVDLLRVLLTELRNPSSFVTLL